MFKKSKLSAVLLATSVLAACGGSGSSDNNNAVTPVISDDGYAFCSAPDANEKLFEYMKEWYLWNDELPASFDPESQPDVYSALEAMTADVSRDRFSFAMTKEQYEDYSASVFFGYGFSHQVTENKDGLHIRYAYEEGTPYQQGLRRGDIITKIGDTSVAQIISQVEAGTATYDDYFGPNEDGYEIDITFVKPSDETLTKTISKGSITANTVMATQTKDRVVDGKPAKVGYIVFNSFDAVSEEELNESITELKDKGVDELVLDLRYNGGGLIRVAQQLSTQIAGTNVEDEVFINYTFNESKSSQNQTVYFGLGEGIDQLDLDRVVVLTTDMSCSSSELVINGLSPFIDVVQVGGTSCGKPAGMSPEEICNDVVFAINFEGQNAEGFGDYYDGLEADCKVEDALVGDWGDDNDPLLAEGLSYLENGSCSPAVATTRAAKSATKTPIDWTKGPMAPHNRL